MEHYAKILDGHVTKVVALDDGKFGEFIDDSPGQWVKADQRVGVGFTFDAGKFAPPQPFKSWKLDASNTWKAPVEYPSDGKSYRWDEDSLSWVEENL